MNQRKSVALGIVLVLFTLSLFILSIVSAEPNVARGGAQVQGINTPGVSSPTSQQPSSCSNPQQCREIDEVWQMIGTNVRGSSEVWDVSTTNFGWRAFTAVYVPTPTTSAPSGTSTTGGVMPAGYCFPVERNSFKDNGNLNNWGDDRSKGERCHAGIDLLTQGEGKVVAVDEGEVIATQNFVRDKDCNRGTSVDGKALLIYHKNIQYQDAQGNVARGITINYGEMDADKIASLGNTVQKGQYLGRALTCGMLHFEIYNGRVAKTNQWDQNLPGSTIGENICAKEQGFLAVKPPAIMDPTNFINSISGNYCGGISEGENAFDSFIKEAHTANPTVDEFFIKAIIKHESNFKPHLISSTGCVGLMQICTTSAKYPYITKMSGSEITPDTNLNNIPGCCEGADCSAYRSRCMGDRSWCVQGGYRCTLDNDDRFDPRKNIFSGTLVLKAKMDKIGECGNDRVKAWIAAYNLGEKYVQNAITTLGNCNNWQLVWAEMARNSDYSANTIYGDHKVYNVENKINNLKGVVNEGGEGDYVGKVFFAYQQYYKTLTS